MKKNNLVVLIAFFLIFEIFLVSGVILDNNQDFNENQFSLDNREIISSSQNLIYDKSFLNKENFNEGDYSGYIIEFEELSITEKRVELEKAVESNKNLFLTKIPIIKEFFMTSDNLNPRIQRYEYKINAEHENLKIKISDKISAASDSNSKEILREYKLVFNGLALDISDEDAKEIEKIKGIKRVYPNYKVQATLMDSVPLIQEGVLAGQLDRNGNDCTISGEECLTGEGVTIAIIDTGVDYTHPDLGGSVVEENIMKKITSNRLDLWGHPDDAYKSDQQISLNNNRLVFYSGREVYLYSLLTNSTQILFESPSRVIKLDLENEFLAYFNEDGAYVYNLNTKETKEINTYIENDADVGTIHIRGDKVVYGIIHSNSPEIVIYDIPSEQKSILPMRSWSSDVSPKLSGDLIAYSLSTGPCYDSIVLYNITSGTTFEISPSNVGPVLDFKGDKILYLECSKNDFDYSWKHYRVYDLSTGISTPFYTGFVSEGVETTSIGGTFGWINKGILTQNYIYFSKDVNANRAVIYDSLREKYFQLNVFLDSGVLVAENDTLCFLDKTFNLYCHEYNSSYDYSIPEVSFNSKVIGGYDFIKNNADPMDDHGHGTHVASTAAGNRDWNNDGKLKPNKGLSGVAPGAKILAYKVLDSHGRGLMEGVVAAIERAVDPNQDGDFSDHADIISMSLGASCMGLYSDFCGPNDPISQAVDVASDAGVVVVISAGNSGPSGKTIATPGTARNAITVGATDKQDNLASFSSKGPVIWEDENENEKVIIKPDVLAPGVNICAAQSSNKPWDNKKCFDDTHISISGTSMATPHVAGVVALLLQKNPVWTPEEIKSALKGTAKDLGLSPTEQGSGRINLKEAMKIKGKPLIAELNEMNYKISGIIDIEGTAGGDNFERYEVSYIEEDKNWNLICSGTREVHKGVLCGGFDSSLIEGDSYLRLSVFGDKGKILFSYNLFISKNLEINYPEDEYLAFEEDIIEIRGIVHNGNLSNYKILVDGVNPQTREMELTNNGKTSVIKDILGYWNISGIGEGYHSLSIEINLKNGTTLSSGKNQWIYIDPYLIKDAVRNVNSEVYVPVVSGDVYGDKKEEIIFKDYSGYLHVLDSGGNYVPGWPRKIDRGGWLSDTTPVLADLNGDEKLEIVIQSSSSNYFENFGTIDETFLIILYSDGSNKTFIFPKANEGPPTITPVVADLNNDGKLEVISSFGYDGSLSIFDNNLNLIQSYLGRSVIGKSIGSSPVVADLNNDGKLEVIIVTQNEYEGRFLHALKLDGSNVFPPINFQTEDENIYVTGQNNLAIGDIDKDGEKEIIISYEGHLTVYNEDGTIQEGNWPKSFNEISSEGLISLADIDGDGYLEIFFGSYSGNLYGYKYNGALLEGWEYKGVGAPLFSLIAGDINNDGEIDLVGGTADYRNNAPKGKIYSFDAAARNLNKGWPKPINSLIGNRLQDPPHMSPIISDFNKDGLIDIFFVSSDGTIYLWNLNSPYNPDKMDWSMFQHDSQHTGCYDCNLKINLINQTSLSKIQNFGNINKSILLSINLQKFENNNWINNREIINGSYNILANESLDLRELFNSKNVKIKFPGKYRLNITATDSSRKTVLVSSLNEFNVSSLLINAE